MPQRQFAFSIGGMDLLSFRDFAAHHDFDLMPLQESFESFCEVLDCEWRLRESMSAVGASPSEALRLSIDALRCLLDSLLDRARRQLAYALNVSAARGGTRLLCEQERDRQPVVGRRWSNEAMARGWEILKANLSPTQLEEFEAGPEGRRSFHVVGQSGCFYRVCEGTSQNVVTISDKGRPEQGLCFLPEGDLVPGDVMLAQKVALELNEQAALKVAIPFDINYVRVTAGERSTSPRRLKSLRVERATRKDQQSRYGPLRKAGRALADWMLP
jgi:hypothetical protein